MDLVYLRVNLKYDRYNCEFFFSPLCSYNSLYLSRCYNSYTHANTLSSIQTISLTFTYIASHVHPLFLTLTYTLYHTPCLTNTLSHAFSLSHSGAFILRARDKQMRDFFPSAVATYNHQLVKNLSGCNSINEKLVASFWSSELIEREKRLCTETKILTLILCRSWKKWIEF